MDILSLKTLVAFHCDILLSINFIYVSFLFMSCFPTASRTREEITIAVSIFLLFHRVYRKVLCMERLHLEWGSIIEIPQNSKDHKKQFIRWKKNAVIGK